MQNLCNRQRKTRRDKPRQATAKNGGQIGKTPCFSSVCGVMQKRLPTRKNRPKNGLLIFGKDEVPGSNPGNSSNKRDVKLTVLRLFCYVSCIYNDFQFFFVMRFLPEEMARSGQTSTQRWQPTHFFPSRIGFLASFSRMAWCPPSAHEISQRPQPMHFSR